MVKVPNFEKFTGCYTVKGASKWAKQDDAGQQIEFIVSQRKQPTAKKPKDFLLYRIGNSRPQYFSSIYSNDTGQKWVEYGGVHYSLDIKPQQVCISYMGADAD